MAERFVLDSFALVAVAQDEPGTAEVQRLLEQAGHGACALYLSVVTVGEVFYIVHRRQGHDAAARVLGGIEQLPIALVPVDRDMALLAASTKAETNLGYADCFVAALARALDATVVTGDPDFRRVAGLVQVAWLRQE